jgi:hypothetical protein
MSIKDLDVTIVSGIATAVGSVMTWLGLRKYEQQRAISDVEKNTKINNVDGDKALIDQLDLLLNKVAAMSQMLYKLQEELHHLNTKEFNYKSAIFRIRLICQELGKDSEVFIKKIEEILKELKIDIDERINRREDQEHS